MTKENTASPMGKGFRRARQLVLSVLPQFTNNAVAFGTTQFGGSILMTIFNLYITDLFTSVYRISSSHFYAGQVGFALWNAVNDPLFAWLIDTSGGSGGGGSARRIPAIKYGGPLWCVAFLLPWWPWAIGLTEEGSGSWIVAVHYCVSLCMFDAFLTYVLLVHCALLADLTADNAERNNFNNVANFFGLIGSAVGAASYYTYDKKDLSSFRIFCVSAAILACGGFLYTGKELRLHRMDGHAHAMRATHAHSARGEGGGGRRGGEEREGGGSPEDGYLDQEMVLLASEDEGREDVAFWGGDREDRQPQSWEERKEEDDEDDDDEDEDEESGLLMGDSQGKRRGDIVGATSSGSTGTASAAVQPRRSPRPPALSRYSTESGHAVLPGKEGGGDRGDNGHHTGGGNGGVAHSASCDSGGDILCGADRLIELKEVDRHPKLKLKLTFAAFCRQLLGHGSFWLYVAMNFMQNFNNLFDQSLFVFFDEKLFANSMPPLARAALVAASLNAPRIMVQVLTPFANRHGTYSVIMFGALFKLFAGCMMALVGRGAWMIWAVLFLGNALTAPISQFYNLAFSDVIDEDMLKNRRRQSVSVSVHGVQALFVKPAQSLAPMLGMALLPAGAMAASTASLRAHPAELAHVQSSAYRLMWAVPVACGIVQTLIWRAYTLHGAALRRMKHQLKGWEDHLMQASAKKAGRG